jgi:hypothetical protein
VVAVADGHYGGVAGRAVFYYSDDAADCLGLQAVTDEGFGFVDEVQEVL